MALTIILKFVLNRPFIASMEKILAGIGFGLIALACSFRPTALGKTLDEMSYQVKLSDKIRIEGLREAARMLNGRVSYERSVLVMR